MKSKFLVILITGLYTYVLFNRFDAWKNTAFYWDKLGYYSYLPAIFIYKDLQKLSFYPAIAGQYHFTADVQWYAVYEQPNGNRTNKYPVGVAVFELPFFLLADAYVIYCSQYPRDGFSIPYQLAVAMSNIFWVMIGLLFLRSFLRCYFEDNVVAITLPGIGLGTNLYLYTAFDQGMSHPISFSLFAALLFFTSRFYESGKSSFLYGLALILGFIVITRPVNIVAVVLPLLWNIHDRKGISDRLRFFALRYKDVVVAGVAFCLVIFLQLAYWKYATGHWVHYSYEEEGFNFRNPKIWKGLFSWRKGWFIYTPVALVGMVGLFHVAWKYRQLVWPFGLFLATIIYITFSWKCWWYGGGYGCRPLIDILPVVAFPLAAISSSIYLRMNYITKSIFTMVVLFFIALNMFQSYQFSRHIIHYDRMSGVYYFKTFGKTEIDHAEYDKYLYGEEELAKDIREIQQ